jgi:hypothetical protein
MFYFYKDRYCSNFILFARHVDFQRCVFQMIFLILKLNYFYFFQYFIVFHDDYLLYQHFSFNDLNCVTLFYHLSQFLQLSFLNLLSHFYHSSLHFLNYVSHLNQLSQHFPSHFLNYVFHYCHLSQHFRLYFLI